MGLLSLAIWTPIVFGVVLLAFGRDEHAPIVRWIALIGAIVSLLVTLPLYSGFETGYRGDAVRRKSRPGSSVSTCPTTWVWTASRSGSCC